MATKTKAKAQTRKTAARKTPKKTEPEVPQSELAVQLHEVKMRASDQNAELERLRRQLGATEKERDDARSFEDKNTVLRAENRELQAQVAALENERDTAVEYANANEGAARRLQAIRDALA